MCIKTDWMRDKWHKTAGFMVAAAVVAVLSGCDMLESHPYDAHVSGERYLTEKNIARIEAATAGKSEIKFAMISDTQRGYDETEAVVKVINARGDIDFVLHGGDLTEFGSTREYHWKRDILAKFEMPYVCVIGNHDCLATGLDVYATMYGPLNFSFRAGEVEFLCLNTNAVEFHGSEAVPDFRFIKNELAALAPDICKTVVLMHAGPFSEQFNNNVADEFHALIRQFPGLQFALYGHGHHITVDDFFGDGILYYQCTNIKKRSYLVFTITDAGYEYEVVYF